MATNAFKKPTHMNIYLSFDFHHPLVHAEVGYRGKEGYMQTRPPLWTIYCAVCCSGACVGLHSCPLGLPYMYHQHIFPEMESEVEWTPQHLPSPYWLSCTDTSVWLTLVVKLECAGLSTDVNWSRMQVSAYQEYDCRWMLTLGVKVGHMYHWQDFIALRVCSKLHNGF